MIDSGYIERNYNALLAEIKAAAGGRKIDLVAVTKSGSDEELLALAALGVTDIGENRPQELKRRGELLAAAGFSPRLHQIGSLQKGNVKYIIDGVAMIHSVDSLALAEKISRLATERGRVIPVLVEINSAREEQKGGIMPEDAEDFTASLKGLPGISPVGIMTMGPRVGDGEDLRPYFRETRRLFDRLFALGRFDGEPILSMGMSASFRVAIEEGATLVRVGTRLFEK